MIASKGVQQLDRVARLTRAEFERDYLARNRPVLITGQLTGWAAVDKWNFDYLESVAGNQPVEIEFYPSGKRHDAFIYSSMTLGQYIRLIRDNPDARQQYYLAEKPIGQVLPGLMSDFKTPELVDQSRDGRTVIFLGHDTFTTGHYHRSRTQALLTQIQGQKRLMLWPPNDLNCLYLSPWYSLRSNHSRVPFDQQSREALELEFPLLANARPIEVTVESGETLFIPDHWMHTAEGIGASLSITFFWNDALKYAHARGVARDFCSDAVKRVMVSVASVGNRLGLNRALVGAAALAGVVQRSEKEAVLEYLNKYGAKRPNQRELEHKTQTAMSATSK